MQLSTQLKRGYLALIGLSMLSASLVVLPEGTTAEPQLVQKILDAHACRTDHQTRWKLASTPFDMPSLPSYKIKLCQS